MKELLVIVLLAIFGVAFIESSTNGRLVPEQSQNMLMKYLVQSAANPSNSVECFDEYLPILSEISSTFSEQYKACGTVADGRINNLTEQSIQKQTDFTTITTNICNTFENCDKDSNILNYFDCVSAASSVDVSILYTLSTSASDAATFYTQTLKKIQLDEAECKNDSEQTYVKNTAKTYDLLNDCLDNGYQAASTVETESSSASTLSDEDTTVTEESSTVATFERIDEISLNNVQDSGIKMQCSNGTGTHTQTSADGTQTQTQTGPGCQMQSSINGTVTQSQNSTSSSQSQSSNGNGSQSQSQSSNSTSSQSQSQSSSVNGTVIQSQNSTSSSQSQSSNNSTQSQCSGISCGGYNPYPPIFGNGDTGFQPYPLIYGNGGDGFQPYPPMYGNGQEYSSENDDSNDDNDGDDGFEPMDPIFE